MPTIIISVLIGSYSMFVIYKKVKDMKAGKFCSGNCSNCGSSCKTK